MSMIETVNDVNNSFLARREITCNFRGLAGKLKKSEAVDMITKEFKLSGKTVIAINLKNHTGRPNILGTFYIYDDEKTAKIQAAFHKNPFNLINRYRYGRIRKKINSYYKPNIIVTNKFNRCVIFPSHNFHRAQNFFGTSLENSRLTIVSFMSEHEI